MSLHNATMPAGRALPTQYLFRPANPAFSPAVGRRDSVGPICADYETKCAQGDWCCDTGETCSFDTINGAFLCCGASAGATGCSRVCAAGTFRCASVCCSYGQVCFGGDTVSGYCVNQNSYASISTSRTLAATHTTTRYADLATGTRAPNPISTPLRDGSQNDNPSSQGVSLGLQIAIGVAVPLIVILIAIGAWFCFSHYRRSKRAPAPRKEDAESFSTSPSPVRRDFPSLPKNAMIVSTPVQPVEFGQPRTPKTSLPPPETSAGTVITEQNEHSTSSTPIIAAPRLATPIDLLSAVATRRTH